MDFIKCGCGCGELRNKYDSQGRELKYIYGHYFKSKKIKLDENKVIKRYNELKSCPKVAKEFGCSSPKISNILKENNIPIDYRNYLKGKKYEDYFGEKVSKELRDNLRNKNIGISAWNKGLTSETDERIKKGSIKSANTFKEKYKRGEIIHPRGFLGGNHTKKSINKIKKARATQIFPEKDTTIEVKIQDFLKKLKIEFFTHQYMNEIKYSYQCDIFIPVQKGIPIKTIIECDGDYWHGNPEIHDYRKLITSIRTKRILDFERTNQLEEQGFRVIRLWEHEIKEMEVNDLKQRVVVSK